VNMDWIETVERMPEGKKDDKFLAVIVQYSTLRRAKFDFTILKIETRRLEYIEKYKPGNDKWTEVVFWMPIPPLPRKLKEEMPK